MCENENMYKILSTLGSNIKYEEVIRVQSAMN